MRFSRLIILVIVTAGVYVPTVFSGFVAGDYEFIVRNETLNSFRTVIDAFAGDYWSVLGGREFVYYRPLVVFTHYVDCLIYGTWPAGHHVSNIVYHTACTVLVYILLLLLLPGRRNAAFAGSLVFGLHPVHTHSVSYVLGRTDILAALFFISALILFVRSKRCFVFYPFAGLLYFCALLCKEIAITLPLILLLYHLLWQGERFRLKSAETASIFTAVCVAAVYLAVRHMVLDVSLPGEQPYTWQDLSVRAPVIIITCGYYISKLLIPANLCYYSNAVIPATMEKMLVSPLFVAGVLFIGISFLLLIRFPRVSFAMLWIMVTLLPVLNIIPLPAFAKENYLYLPSAGLCLLCALFFVRLSGRRRYTLLYGVVTIICACLAVLTIQRNRDYKNQERFLKQTLRTMSLTKRDPSSDLRYEEVRHNYYTVYQNLGYYYRIEGMWEQAARAFERALLVGSAYPASHTVHSAVSLGIALEKSGRLDRAYRVLHKALDHTPRPFYVHNLLGVVSARKGDSSRAEHHFKKAVSCKSDYAPAYYNLWKLYGSLGLPEKAADAIEKAADSDPHYSRYRRQIPLQKKEHR